MSTSIIPGPNIFRAVSGSLFSSPVNWSRGVVPTGSDVAMIADNCTIDISRTIGSLVVRAPFTASINTGLTLTVKEVIDVKGHLSCSGAPNIISEARKNNINSLSAGSSTFTYSGTNQNVPGLTYNNLTIANIGTKKIIGHTTLNGNLYVIDGIIDFSAYNITINGTSTIQNNPGKILKTGSGNVTFIGLLTIGTSGNNGGTIDFSGGNPNVEFRNGLTGDYSNAVTFKSGTGTWRFTTNNQKLGRISNGGIWVYDCQIQIENIVLSVQADGGGGGGVNVFKNSVNGTTAGSSLINYSTIEFQGPTTFMTTGTFDFTTNSNNVSYNTSTSFVVPYGTYWTLYLSGTGSKTLSQNTTLYGNLNIAGPTDLTTYNLDVYGTTFIGYTTLSKSGAGNITFRGALSADPEGRFNFSGGNPNVEFRNGLTLIYNGSVNSGTGTWSFTTNNQTLQINGIQNNYQFNCTISIVNINLTMNSNNRTFTFANPINGTTGTSSLIILATSTIQYNSATQPMVTGILDTSTNLNTWIYGSGSQDIKGNTYRNLTLNGGGTKTLQGNVSVQNTYTLTAPATLNNNGFTLTNP